MVTIVNHKAEDTVPIFSRGSTWHCSFKARIATTPTSSRSSDVKFRMISGYSVDGTHRSVGQSFLGGTEFLSLSTNEAPYSIATSRMIMLLDIARMKPSART